MTVINKMQTRDYLRCFITKINDTLGVKFNASKLNSRKECEEYILKLLKQTKTKQDLLIEENNRLKNSDNTITLEETERNLKEIKELKKAIKKLFCEKEEIRELLIKRMEELDKTEKELNTKEIELLAIKSKLEELRAIRNLTIFMTSLISILATLMVVILFR